MEIGAMLSLMVEKGYLSEDNMGKILGDEDFKKKRKERTKKKKTSNVSLNKGYDADKCHAREWNEGYDNVQCDFSKLDNGCLCKKHQTCSDKDGGWWLGMITEERPKNPIWRGVEHFWRTEEELVGDLKHENKKADEGEVSPEPKKKRGRPKGSKNKKKTVEKKELTIEEIMTLLEEKKDKEKEEKENKVDDNDKKVDDNGENFNEECKKYIVDGVPYEIKDDEIMDPEDFSPMGVTDGKGGITFEDEDSEEKHRENVEKYRV